jgi:ABC-2 type transport system permease protein
VSQGAWRLIAARELRDLWVGGRGVGLALIAAILFSLVTYLSASEASLNLLDAKEAVHLLLQVVIIVGGLLTLVVAADAVSGERDRRTLEPVLLAPISRRDIAIGKLIAAISLWLATLLVAVPYIVVLADGPGLVATALVGTAVIGTLIAVCLAGFGFIVSGLSSSNRLSLAMSLFAVLALTAPSRVPQITKSTLGDAILHVNPITSGLGALERLTVKGDAWGDVTGWLISPAVGAVAITAIAVAAAVRLLALDRSPA